MLACRAVNETFIGLNDRIDASVAVCLRVKIYLDRALDLLLFHFGDGPGPLGEDMEGERQVRRELAPTVDGVDRAQLQLPELWRNDQDRVDLLHRYMRARRGVGCKCSLL